MAAQLPDRILLQGQWMDLYTNPLELYWHLLNKKRPSFYPLPHCRRGYVTHWVLKNNQLFLSAIDGNVEKQFLFFQPKSARYHLTMLFPRSSHRLVLASWFSGKLRIPQGKMTQFEPAGYNSRFEKEIIITVDRGTITKMVTIDYAEKKLVINVSPTTETTPGIRGSSPRRAINQQRSTTPRAQ
jgi:hypothetical protein